MSRRAPSRTAPPLLRGQDHGEPITVRAKSVGAEGDRWLEPFVAANAEGFQRLDLRYEIRISPAPHLLVKPGGKIGAVPLVSASTRRAVAGLLIEPRFQWASLGSVFGDIGFSVEPRLGGLRLVPGSAREVPPWLLAGPVIERISALLKRTTRGFVERTEVRASPRGQVLWSAWASGYAATGNWGKFPCRFSEPEQDPELLAAVRWTMAKVVQELSVVSWSLPARQLLARAAEIQQAVGPGLASRPRHNSQVGGMSEWVAAALEAMTWVAEERGLGGARALDGLAWDLSIDAVWEAWVARIAARLALRLGLAARPYQSTRRSLRWQGPAQSMGSLVPDIELHGSQRVVWIDAKYKRHHQLLTRGGWAGMAEQFRAEHRADLHQALAYASLADAPQVDTVLLYPQESWDERTVPTTATVTAGRRRVRITLAAIPFGFHNLEQEDRVLGRIRDALAA